MNNIINIFDMEVSVDSAKDLVREIAQNLEKERIYTVSFVTMDPLLQEKDNEDWKKKMRAMDLLVPGGRGVLGAEERTYRALAKEIEDHAFPKLLIRFLQKNKKSLYLIAASEENLDTFESGLRVFGQNIRISGRAVLQENGVGTDKIINEINGVEPDCVFSALPSPLQENFISANKALLNTRVWVSCGTKILEEKHNSKISGKLRMFIMKKIIRYHMGKHSDDDNV